MVANKTVLSRYGQRPDIKCLEAEKWKPCEIYRSLCDVHGETRFSQKNV